MLLGCWGETTLLTIAGVGILGSRVVAQTLWVRFPCPGSLFLPRAPFCPSCPFALLPSCPLLPPSFPTLHHHSHPITVQALLLYSPTQHPGTHPSHPAQSSIQVALAGLRHHHHHYYYCYHCYTIPYHPQPLFHTTYSTILPLSTVHFLTNHFAHTHSSFPSTATTRARLSTSINTCLFENTEKPSSIRLTTWNARSCSPPTSISHQPF